MAAVTTRSFAAVLFLMAKGYAPVSVERVRDGSGGVLYRLPLEADEALDEFYKAKALLKDLTDRAGAR